MPLREEVVQVEKQPVETGEVRLHKEVVEEQQSLNVPLTHEEVVVERRPLPGGRPSETPIGQQETIRVPVSEEQVQVTKTPVETGEIVLGKRLVHETQQVTETVRREEPRIEQEGNAPLGTNEDLATS